MVSTLPGAPGWSAHGGQYHTAIGTESVVTVTLLTPGTPLIRTSVRLVAPCGSVVAHASLVLVRACAAWIVTSVAEGATRVDLRDVQARRSALLST